MILKKQNVSPIEKETVESLLEKHGYSTEISDPLTKLLKKQIDYAEVGGAPLIGIKGCVIVSHGKSNARAIENAIYQAISYVDTNVNEHILEKLEE